eukprot:scaffold118881_cov17-Tisochrysis_lutea.AAC.1
MWEGSVEAQHMEVESFRFCEVLSSTCDHSNPNQARLLTHEMLSPLANHVLHWFQRSMLAIVECAPFMKCCHAACSPCNRCREEPEPA